MPTIYHQFFIKADIDKVFAAITLSDQLENWWPLRCNGKVAENAEYNFYFGDPFDWYARITQLQNNVSIEYKMTKADEDWLSTTFGFYLLSNTQGTIVNFAHKNWPSENDHFKVASFCWAMLINDLKNYVEKGIIVPFESRS